MRTQPYFLMNPKWYREITDEDGNTRYELTDAAPEKAVRSFDDYNSQPVFYNDDGEEMVFGDDFVIDC